MDESTMRERILAELTSIEAEKKVTILFACESGSRAWGFPSADSDFDVRMVYMHDQDWYLDLQKQRDVIEKPIIDELDISGWDLKKALCLLRKSNPGILEWTGSPIVYRELPGFAKVRQLIDESFNHRASVLHYLNMSQNNRRQWLQRDLVTIKKYLYAIRPLLCALWVLKHGTQPPMLYKDLLRDVCGGTRVEAEVEELVRLKLDQQESDKVPRHEWLNQWIDETVASVEAQIPGKCSLPDWTAYNTVFRELIA